MKRVILLLFALLPVPSAQAADGSGARIADEFARPALQALVESAGRHGIAVDALCAGPDTEKLEAARKTFDTLVTDFARASVLRFGPLAAESRIERLFFWPDPRGIALRQVQGVLGKTDDTAARQETLADKSAALQGIPALEFVLFGSGSEQLGGSDGAFRCAYAAAISRNIGVIAEETLDGWSPDTAFARSFTAPSADAEIYRSAQEVDGEIVKAMSTALQFLGAAELRPPLGETPEKANGRRAPLWRSDLTFALAQARIGGVQALLDASGYAETVPSDQAYAIDSLRFELNTASTQLGEIDVPVEAAFADEAARGHLTVALLALDHARDLVSEDLSAALGLTMGFNALDGD
jgi:predicted lipoprotein